MGDFFVFAKRVKLALISKFSIAQIFHNVATMGLLTACYIGVGMERYVSYVTNEQDVILPSTPLSSSANPRVSARAA